MIYLYLKTHKITGLKYLGKTKYNPFTYKGSGIDWKKHIQEYGNNVTTQIIKECKDNEELNIWGRYYSTLWDVVNSAEFANRIPETGGGVGSFGFKHSEETKEKLRNNNLGKKQTEETKRKRASKHLGRKNSEQTKEKMSISARNRAPVKEETKKKQSESAKSRKKHAWSGKKRPTKQCPHCKKIGADYLMTRWHFDNCRFKIL